MSFSIKKRISKEMEVGGMLARLEKAGYEMVERPFNETAVKLSSPALSLEYKV